MAGSRTEELIVEIKAQNAQFTKAMKMAQKDLTKVSKASGGMTKSFFKANIAANLVTAGFRHLTMGVRESFKAFLDFDDSLREINTLLDDSSKLTKEFSANFIAMSNNYGKDVQEQTKGFYQIVSAGITDTNEALKLLNIANQAAVGGISQVNTAIDAITNVINAYGKETITAEKASDILFTTVRLGKTTFNELASSLGQVLPVGAAAGVSFEELSATLANLTKVGLSTPEAVTSLKAALANVIKPGKEAQDMARDLGIEFSSQAIKAKGFVNFLFEVIDKTGGAEAQLAKLFPSIRGLAGILAISGADRKSFISDLEAMNNSAKATKMAFEEMRKSTGFQFQVLMKTAKNLGVVFFKVFDSEINWIIRKTIKSVQWLAQEMLKLSVVVKNVGSYFKWFSGLLDGTYDSLDDLSRLFEANAESVKAFEEAFSDEGIKKIEKLTFAVARAKQLLQQGEADAIKTGLGEEDKKRAEDILERLKHYGKTRVQIIKDTYAEENALLKKHMEEENMTREQQMEAQLRLQKETNDRLAMLRAESREAQMNDLASIFGSLSELAKGESKKSFQTAKKLAYAEAVVSGASAVQKAIANPPGWPLNALAVAKAGLMTAANLKKISAQKFKTGVEKLPGVGTKDNIPAMLAPGEGVIDAGTNKDLIDFLKYQKVSMRQGFGERGQDKTGSIERMFREVVKEKEGRADVEERQSVDINLKMDNDELSRIIEAEIINNEYLSASARGAS